MENSTSDTSNPKTEPSSNPSVLDFLYHDSRRIGSYLAQFEGDGHLQQFTRTKDGAKGRRESSGHEAKGNVGFAGGKLTGETETTFDMAEGYTQVFDPFWSNARAFLDSLSKQQMLQRDIRQAAIGQFVIATGYLSVLDLAMLKEAWKIPSVQRKIKNGNVGQKTANMTATQKAAAKEEKENTDMFLDLIQMMPHSVHARLITGSDDYAQLVWCTLDQDNLVAPASDITLTYGNMMPGKWSVVGILSAQPEFVTPDLTQQFDTDDLGLMHSVVGQFSKLLAPIVRFTLGRPTAAYAVTPLLIFREVT